MKRKKSWTYRLSSVLRLVAGKPRPRTAAVILAGGSGTRFGGETPKQFLPINGVSVLIRSLLAFDASPYIDELVAVVPLSEIDSVTELCRKAGIRKLRSVVAGGGTRQASALAGFSAISKEVRYVAFHDAARCLVTTEIIADVTAEAYVWRAASAGVPVRDTLKRTDDRGFILGTVDREHLMAAQTPQVIESRLYRAAAYSAQKEGAAVTDDNSILERIGQAVRMVECPEENFKITTKEDFRRAEAILRQREEEEDRR